MYINELYIDKYAKQFGCYIKEMDDNVHRVDPIYVQVRQVYW